MLGCRSTFHFDFFSAWPRPLKLNSEIWGCARLLREPLGFRVKKWYFLKRSGRGSNPRPQASEEDALSTLLRPTWPNHWACKDFFGTNWNMWIISFHWYLIIRIMVWSWRSVEIRCFWQISSLSLVHTSRPKPMKRARSYSSVYWKRNNENSVSKVLEEYSKYFLLRFPFACTMHDLGSGHSLTMA